MIPQRCLPPQRGLGQSWIKYIVYYLPERREKHLQIKLYDVNYVEGKIALGLREGFLCIHSSFIPVLLSDYLHINQQDEDQGLLSNSYDTLSSIQHSDIPR